MKKLFATASALLAMLVAACGNNGFRSPDLDLIWVDIIVEGPVQAAVGDFAQMRALGHFTAPPAAGGATSVRDVTTEVDWSIVQPASTSGSSASAACQLSTTPANNLATVDANGLVHALAIGTVYVKATQKNVDPSVAIVGCKPFTIVQGNGGGGGQVILQALKITPDAASIPAGTDFSFHVQGVYSDAPNTPRDLNPGTEVTWTSSDTSEATVSTQQGDSTTAIVHGVAPTPTNSPPVTLTASTTNSQGNTVSDTASVTVTAGVVKSIIRVEPPTAQVVVSYGQPFIACGTFSDGTVDPDGSPCSVHPTPDRTETGGHPIPNDDLVWTSSDHTIADDPTAPSGSSTATAVGKAVGVTTITAAFRTTDAQGHPVQIGDPPPAQRSATATLSVVAGPLCVPAGALLANYPNPPQGMPPKAKVTTEFGSFCLACTVDNPDAVIDAPPTDSASDTFASINVTLGALDLITNQGFAAISVHAQTAQGDLGPPFVLDTMASDANPMDGVGFIIAREVGSLAAADVLGQATIITYKDNKVAQNFNNAGNGTATHGGSDTLALDLLGTPVGDILGTDIQHSPRFILYSDKITAPFDTMQLRFGPGIASALSTLDVFNACTDVEVAPPPAQ